MKTLVLLGLVALATATPLSTYKEFESMKTKFNKVYESPTEEEKRFGIFQSNLEFINKHNEEAAAGKHTFTVAVNKFADMTNEEFRNEILGSITPNKMSSVEEKFYQKSNIKTGDAIDYRDLGYVTGVKDQQSCGSCWAFSATGSMEGAYFKKTGDLVSQSEQNLVDCNALNAGCNGGRMQYAFYYVVENNGINTEANYPYTARDGVCKFDSNDIAATISTYYSVRSGSEEDLTSACYENGPISVAMDAGQTSFQFYSDGIYYDSKCSSTRLNHGVLMVGYDTNSMGEEYYIVKNSWGTSWGDKGYFWLARNMDNHCGVATDSSYAVA